MADRIESQESTSPILRSTMLDYPDSEEEASNTFLSRLERNDPSLAIDLIAQNGLQTPGSVLIFLKSESGKLLLDKLAAEWEEKEALLEDMREENLRIAEYELRLLALLLLGLLEADEALAEERLESTQAEQERLHKKDQAHARDVEAAEQAKQVSDLTHGIEIHERAITGLEAILNQLCDKSQTLQNKWLALEEIIAQAAEQYATFKTALKDADQLADAIGQTTQDPIEQISQLEAEIARIEQRFKADAKVLSNYFASGDLTSKEALQQLAKCNAANLQTAAFRDRISVLKGDKHLYTAEGVRTESFAKAVYLVDKTKQLVNDKEGHLCLVAASPAHNDTDRAQGKEQFLQLKPQLLVVKKLAKHNKTIENETHRASQEKLCQRSERMQDKIIQLNQQINDLYAAKARLMTQREALTAKPTRSGQQPSPKPMAPRPTATLTRPSNNVSKALACLMTVSAAPGAIQYMQQMVADAKLANSGLGIRLSALKNHDHISQQTRDDLAQLRQQQVRQAPPKEAHQKSAKAEPEALAKKEPTAPTPLSITPFGIRPR